MPPTHLAGPAPFVGRERELGLLSDALARACRGEGLLVLLAGEPGIGKTRLAEELAARAPAQGARVLWGRTYEGEGAPAYWPWVELLRSFLRGVDAAGLHDLLGAHAAEIAQVFPEVRALLPDLAEPPALEAAHARFRLFDAVSTVLASAAHRQPLVLVLDDLHWADEASLLMLEFLAPAVAAAPLLLIGTYRDVAVRRGHPLARVLGDLTRRPHALTLTLTGLGAAEVSRMVEAAAGAPPTERLVRTLAGKTEGNPLFLAEMMRLMLSDGRLQVDVAGGDADDPAGATRAAVPQTVRAVIGRRLDHLSAECNRVLTVAAVAGRDFDLPPLERVTEVPADALLALFEEAEVARLIEEVAGVPGRYRFTHALVRETLYEELPATRRTRLHRQVGEALEVVSTGDPDARLAELAHHFAAAAGAGGAEKAVLYLRRAGERAIDLLAYEEAARLYRQALALLQLQPCPPAEHGAVLLALGGARTAVGDRGAAEEAFRDALALAKRAGLTELHARAALALAGGTFVTEVQDNRPVITVLEEALAALDPTDSPLRLRLLTRLAFATVDPRAMDRALTVIREAIAMARRIGDRATLAHTLATYLTALRLPEHAAEREAVTVELLTLAEAEGSADLLLGAYERRLIDALEDGDVATVDAALAAYRRLAERLRQPLFLSNVAIWRAMRARMEGRFEEAEALARDALILSQRAGRPDALLLFGGHLVDLRRMQGRMAEVEGVLRRMAEEYPAMAAYRCVLAFLYAETGRLDDARREFEPLAANHFAGVPSSPIRPFLLSVLGRTCAALQDHQRAAQLYPLLMPYAGRAAIQQQGTSFQGATAGALAPIAALLGRDAEAVEHFEAALAFNARARARPFVAQTQVDYATFLRGKAGCEGRATALLQEALSTARDVGMRAVEECAAALLAERPRAAEEGGATDAARRSAEAPGGLTARECDVLRLIAVGNTYKEIAQALQLSPQTVHRHTSNIYRKLDISTRAEAAAFAVRHGLTSA